MDQEKIMEILIRATGSSPVEAGELLRLLVEAIPEENKIERILLERLIFGAIKNDRLDFIPYLYPVFGLLCGNREDRDKLTEADWSLLEALIGKKEEV